MSVTISDLITALRILAHDTPTSNLARQETPGGTQGLSQDGTNKNFLLQNVNIVEDSVYFSLGATFRSQSGFTVDLANGIVTFTTAPAVRPPDLKFDYNWNWFTDTDHTEFLTEAGRQLGFPDPIQADDGLIPALLQYGLNHFWKNRATQYAHRYSSSGGTAGHSVDVVTKAFVALGEEAWKKAEALKTAFYERFGRRAAPSTGVTSFGIDPYTPRR